MSELKTLIKSMQRGTILLPRLQDFVAKQKRLIDAGRKSKKTGVIRDSKLTIRAMQERINEFNHGEEIIGDYFHPSALGGCLRKTWLHHFGAPEAGQGKQDELKTFLTFETGTYFHLFFQNLIERAGYLVKREVAIQNKKLKILGHADAVIEIDGVRYLVELKTINLRGYATVAHQMKHDHKIQIHAYMKALGLEWAIVIYYCKDTSEVREHVVQFDPEFYRIYVQERIDKYFTMIRKKTLPAREESGLCNYCPFANFCFEDVKLKKVVSKL